MSTLHIKKGFVIDTESGYREIIGKHFGSFSAKDIRLDDDENEIDNGTVILTAQEIKNAVHDMTGKAYDYVEFDEDE